MGPRIPFRRRRILIARIGAFAICVFVLVEWTLARRSNVVSIVDTIRSNVPTVVSPLERGADGVTAPRSASVAGTVIDPDRKPIGGARVCASIATQTGRIYEPATCSTSDEKGRYRIDQLSPRLYSLSAMAEGFVAQSTAQKILLSEAESLTGIDIVLQPGGAEISGVVVDATGGPVPHATVRGERPEAPRIAVDTEADDLGRFKLFFPTGPLVLAAAAAAYAPAHTIGVSPSVNVRLVLIPGGRVRGVVVSKADGQPVPNMDVRAVPRRSPGSPLFGSSSSDVNGAFDIRGLEPGGYSIVATGDGWRGESPSPVGLSLGATVENIRVEVSTVAQIEGRVVFANDGRPCDEGFVTLGPPDPRDPPAEMVNTDSRQPRPIGIGADIEPQGLVRFRAVPAGHYYVNVHCAENVLKDGPRVLDVQAKAISKLLWKVGPGLSLMVVTVDELDRPLPGASFSVRIPEWTPGQRNMFLGGTSDATGRYELRGLHVGTYEVNAVAPYEAQPIRAEMHEGADRVEAKLKIGGSASIVALVRSPGGDPIDELAVYAEATGSAPDAGARAPQRYVATAQGKGSYLVRPLRPGRYELWVEDGANPRVDGGAYVLATGDSANASVELNRGEQIRGHVIGDDGVALADAWVTANAESEGRGDRIARPFQRGKGARVLTNEDGEFVLDGIANGDASYTLRAELPSGMAGVLHGIKAGEQSASIAVASPGSLAGSVIGGCTASAVSVLAVNTETGQTATQQLAVSEGTFLLQPVGPGHIQLKATCQDGSGYAAMNTELAPKQSATGLRLVLQSLSADSLPGPRVPGGGPPPTLGPTVN